MLPESFHDRLVRLLERHGQREEVAHVDELLARYVGREEALLTAMETMYATPSSPKDAAAVLLRTPITAVASPALLDVPAAATRQAVRSDTGSTPPTPRRVKSKDEAILETPAVSLGRKAKHADRGCSSRIRSPINQSVLERLPDLFQVLGTTTVNNQPCLDYVAYVFLLNILTGHSVATTNASADEPAASSTEVLQPITFARFASSACRLLNEMDESAAAMALRRVQDFLEKCQKVRNTLCVHHSRGAVGTIVRNCHTDCNSCDGDLCFGFYAFCCVRPCVVPRWQRRWLALNAAMDVINVYKPNSVDVAFAIPFLHVVRCIRVSAASMPNVPPPPRCARNAVLWRLSKATPPVEVLLCVEHGSLACSLIDCFRRWQARCRAGAVTMRSQTGKEEQIVNEDAEQCCLGALYRVQRPGDAAACVKVTVWCCRGGYARYVRTVWSFEHGVLHYRVVRDDVGQAGGWRQQPVSALYRWDMGAVQSIAPLTQPPVMPQPSLRHFATLFTFVLRCAAGVSVFCLVPSAEERQWLMHRIAECRLRTSFLSAKGSEDDAHNVKVMPLPTLLALPSRTLSDDETRSRSMCRKQR